MQRSFISLIVGVVLAVVAVVFINLYVNGLRSAPAPVAAMNMSNVVVAAVNLPFGTKVKPEYLKVVQWPTASVPKDVFQSVDDVFANAQGADRIALKPIDREEPVLKTKISGFGAKATLSREVTNGMRAVSIRIDDVSGVAGFILPGDRVDIMLTRRLEEDLNKDKEAVTPNRLVTDIILQNVIVLGIDQLADQERDKPVVARTATVEVTPTDAQKLALAQQAGTLSLALRSVGAVDPVPAQRVEAADLAQFEKRPAPHRVRTGGTGVRVRYGASSVEERPVD